MNEGQESDELERTLRIGTSQFDDQEQSRLRWFGHVERKDDNDWVRGCTMWEAERTREHPKTWWDCVKNDMESLGLSLNDAQFRNKWRRIKGATG